MEELDTTTFRRDYVRYPWDQWCDGVTRKATRGIDYNCATNSFKSALLKAAKRRGFQAQTETHFTYIIFRIIRESTVAPDVGPGISHTLNDSGRQDIRHVNYVSAYPPELDIVEPEPDILAHNSNYGKREASHE